MNTKNIENKLKKKYPQIYLTDIKPTHPLDIKAHTYGRFNNIVKDLYMLDIQTVVCRILCNSLYKRWPRWCALSKPENISCIHLIVVEGMSSYTWSECLIKYATSKQFNKYFELMSRNLDRSVRFINPSCYGQSWKDELLEVPVNLLVDAACVIDDVKERKKMLKRKFETISKIDNETPKKLYKFDNMAYNNNETRVDAFSRTELVMSIDQIRQERIPRKEEGNQKWSTFQYSIPSGYTPVTDSSPIFAIDCEMVECMDEGTTVITKDLASVSIINEKRETVYHKYVKPPKFIVNYLTTYSGITPEIMESTSTTLKNVQDDIANLLPSDAIIAGHSVGNDLEALRLFHPYLIDTSVIYNQNGLRNVKSRLKNLSADFLNREIQGNKALGHDSREDALATMDLILLKLSHSIHFGDDAAFSDTEEEDIKEDLNIKTETITKESVIGSDSVHMYHKKMIEESRQTGQTVGLCDFILETLKNPANIKTVASVNDFTGFSEPWFPADYHKFIANEKAKIALPSKEPARRLNRHQHPLSISQVSCTSLEPTELPEKKWMTKLLKKVVKEFSSLPDHSLCGLIFTDGACSPELHGDSFYGRVYLGINTPPIDVPEI